MGIYERVYLAGPINRLSDEEASDWRKDIRVKLQHFAVKDNLEIRVLDPMRRDYRDKQEMYYETKDIHDSYHSTFVYLDKRDIRDSTIIIANMPYPTIGTVMEVFYAYSLEKYVVIISDNPEITEHGWVLSHSHRICKDVDEAVAHVIDTVYRNTWGVIKK